MASIGKRNIAFIDGQNLYLGTTRNGWKIDLKKFRVYLHDKYAVQEAYYFIGYVSEKEQDLYNNLQKAGFIVIFKEHNSLLLAKKKGNVDTDIVFEIMKQVAEHKEFSKILLVSGDGDYKKSSRKRKGVLRHQHLSDPFSYGYTQSIYPLKNKSSSILSPTFARLSNVFRRDEP